MKHISKYSILLWGALLCTAISRADSSVLSFGARGGMNTYLTGTDVSPKIGPLASFDLGFTYYWSAVGADVGLKTGLDIAYTGCRFVTNYRDQFTNTDYLGNNICYTVTADGLQEQIQQVQLEVPLMLAIRADQVFINIGAKFMMPLWQKSVHRVDKAHIEAYYEAYEVPIHNELITGKIMKNQLTDELGSSVPQYNVLVSTEVGYEWITNHGNVGLGLFFDIAPWSSFRAAESKQLIEVAPITSPSNPPAEVTVNSMSAGLCRQMLDIDFGLKLYYAIEWGSTSHRTTMTRNGLHVYH